MGPYNHSTSVDAKIMASKNCLIIGEHVANFVAEKVTIATIWLAKDILNFSFKCL